MGLRYLGNIIRPGYNPLASNITTGVNTAQYQGVFTLQQQAQAQNTQTWTTDLIFDYTTLLLQSDNAANGAQNNTFLDSSSNAFAITRNGNTTQGSFTPFSLQPGAWSNFFGGSTDYIAFTSIAAYGVGTGNFSVQTFVNFNSISGNQRIFCLGASGTDGINVQFAGSTTQLQLDIANTRIITHTWTPVVGTWYQIDVVRAGTGTNQTTLYINGLSVATGTSSGSVGQNAANIGGLSWNSSFTVNGYVSNVRFSNTARSISAVTTNYSSDANTLLLTAQSNRFVDNSSTGNTFTIGGTPSVQAFSPFAPQFQWTPSVIGGSGFFDGTGDYLSSATSTDLQLGSSDFSLEWWEYRTVLSNVDTAIVCGDGTFNAQLAYYNTGFPRFYLSTTGSSWNVFSDAATGAIAANSWNHFVLTRSGTAFRVFLNGVLSIYATGSGSVTQSTNQIFISGGINGNSLPIEGYISGVRFVKGSIPTSYQTSSTTTNTSIFTPPTAPVTTTSQGATSGDVKYLVNFTNAGIYDGTMKNNLETVGNAQVSTAVVKYGSGSMYFDGTTNTYLAQNPATTDLYAFGSGDFTIECWLYLISTSSIRTVYDSRASGTASSATPTIYIDAGTIKYYVSGADRITGIALTTNQWYHVVVCRSGTSTRMFINGTQVGSTYSDSTVYINSARRPFIAGDSNSAGANLLNGYIDDLRITKGIARYTQNFIPPSVALPRQ